MCPLSLIASKGGRESAGALGIALALDLPSGHPNDQCLAADVICAMAGGSDCQSIRISASLLQVI